MADIFHPTNKNQWFGAKRERQSLPSIKHFIGVNQDTPPVVQQIITKGEILPPSRRLVVIIPDAKFDPIALSEQIRALAAPNHRQVLLLTKPNRGEYEFYSQVNLTSLASLIRDSRIVVQTHVVTGISLVKDIRQRANPDDVLVCFAEHRVPGLLNKNLLAEVLAKKTLLPVYTLQGSISEISEPLSGRFIDFLLLAICILALIGFFILQVWLDQNTTGVLRTILQLLSVIVEVWVVAKCAVGSFRD